MISIKRQVFIDKPHIFMSSNGQWGIHRSLDAPLDMKAFQFCIKMNKKNRDAFLLQIDQAMNGGTGS